MTPANVEKILPLACLSTVHNRAAGVIRRSRAFFYGGDICKNQGKRFLESWPRKPRAIGMKPGKEFKILITTNSKHYSVGIE